MTDVQYLEIDGKRLVVIEEERYEDLLDRAGEDMPALPTGLTSGNFPAIEAARILIARRIIAARHKAGWSQAELARRSDIRVETLNRIEKLKTSPDESTLKKIAAALKKMGIEA